MAKALAPALGAELVRLQCYEGIDVNQALYEWDYGRQLLYVRSLQEAGGQGDDAADEIFGPRFLLERPLLRALRAGDRAVLLVDEIDQADDEFEAFLLEMLSDFQVTVPEVGTIRAEHPPAVVLTSNRTRELHDASNGVASTTGSTTPRSTGRWRSLRPGRRRSPPRSPARSRPRSTGSGGSTS